jgi:signal transduction histidine kinase
MQPLASQHDVVLAWSLQTALSGGLAAACAGLAVTFRRPAMRVLAGFWTLLTVASVFIWAALSSQSIGLTPAASALFAALAFPLTPVLAFVLLRHLLLLLSGRAARAFPAPAVLVTTGTLGFLFAFAVQRVTAPLNPGGTAPITAIMSSAATIIGYAILAFLARDAFRKSEGPRRAIKLLGASFLLFAIRSATNLGVAVMSARRGEPPTFGMTATTVQVSLLVIVGVLQLIAVLEEERASIVQRAEQLRNAETAVARSRGLEELGRMAGAVAHDFNNLLGVIVMSAESARASDSGTTDEDLGEIQATSRRGQELTRQLLAFARQAPQQVMRFDANVQLDKLSGLLKRIVGEHAFLEVAAAGPSLLVEMDGTQFDQVVMNLVVNARDATPSGGTITVRLADSAPHRGTAGAKAGGGPASFVQLTVIDTGTGIPPEVLPHIFEPFFSTKQTGVGTGLGLATCDGIIRQLGGRISVHSEVGKGTRFDVFIPRATAG